MTKIGPKLVEALRMKHKQMYRLAFRVGMHPTTLSKILNGIQQVKPGDKRILRLGRKLGIPPDELFAQEETGRR